MTRAVVVQTPTDFERTLGGNDFLRRSLGSPLPEIEPLYRRAVSQIFDDLEDIDSSDHKAISTYLSGIEEPLNDLRSLGFVIFAVEATGKMSTAKGMSVSNWIRTYYFIVPASGFFRIGKELSGIVHCFNPNCDAAVVELAKAARDGAPIVVWTDKTVIAQQLEGNVPWCVECCLAQ
jgi:hypothetical protein